MAKRKAATTPKPHKSAHRLDVDCACGGEWCFHLIDMSDENATEIPVFARCAKCGKRVGDGE